MHKTNIIAKEMNYSTSDAPSGNPFGYTWEKKQRKINENVTKRVLIGC